jgi:signal transduction histidine kinase
MTETSPQSQILLLDDEPGVARLQQMSLDAAGHSVTAVHTPDAALACLRARRYDLVVLDYQLHHGLTGLDFYRQLRTEGCDVPAILVTGFSDESKVIAALRAGVRDVVPKSGEYLDYLPEAVARVLGQVEAERQMMEAEALRRSEERLRVVNDQLQEADRRKDEFLATLAHELRNPLAPIRFALAVLKDLDPPQARARDIIDRQIVHMVRLVDDLLDVSRITRNQIHLRKEPVKLQAIVQAAVEGAAPLAEAARQRLMVVQPIPDVWVDVDAARMAQVFTNLLNNASKFTPRGGTIWFAAECHAREVRVSVRDSGIGITPEHLPHVFNMFYQAGGTAQHTVTGLGIGLTLVRRLVAMHDGTVEAHSEGAGRGAEFVVTIPAGVATRATAFSPGGRTEEDAGPASRVLIVDDNVDSAELLALVVARLGHEVRTANDGPAAAVAFMEFHPQVALLDIGLPGADGYELAREFRRDAPADLFLVAITGWGQDEDRRRARDAGFDCHLVKPADPAVIERMLAAIGRGERCKACGNCLAAEDGPASR